MRIRHPRFDIPIESPSTTNEMRKHLLNSSQGSSFNKMSDAQQCKSRQSSPHLSSTDGHVSSISGLSESCEDSSNAYLNPDFTDSQLMTKCNSVGPSPLALLARTCQNIGNIMDCSISSNNRFISPTYNSTRKQSTVCSMPITNSNRIINNNNNNTLKLTKSKGVNSNDIISPSSNKRNITTKYLCTNDTIKMNLPTTAITGGESINQVNSVINSTTKINRNNNNNNNSNDSIVNSSLTLHHNTTRQSSPISISSTLFSQVNSIKSSDTSFIFNNNFIKSNDTQQTSNSLEQLARLSSSFSLPETSKLNYTNLKNSNDLIDNRTVWNDIKNTANNITTVCSMPITNSNRIINNNNNNTLKLTKSKGVNSNDIISPSSNKRNITTKYLCTNDTIKMNLPTTAITGGESINQQVNSVINSTTKINRNNNNNNNSNDSIVNSSLTLHHNTTRQSSPISISSTLFSQVNSIKSSDTSLYSIIIL
ncbi:hypothetical protein MN116_000788 [Schistosoma mekongi]|uniref:Uncharacterized protein n=1 Tax=Schistosoma mekongi TaxID=38744 RepID=A0AAE2D8D7_SCHME|nr:hypothetical protein MN116_000788 [Schistosoma mekongi]